MKKFVRAVLPLAGLREWTRRHLYQRATSRVLVLGDSHVRVFEDWRFLLRFPRTRFDVVYVAGGTASGMGNRGSQTGAYSTFLAALDRRQCDWVLINLGEVDTAYTLWRQAETSGKSVQDLVAASVKHYCAFLHEIKQQHSVVVLSACLPTLADHTDSKDEVAKMRKSVKAPQHARTALTLYFNARIAAFCEQNAIAYLNCANEALGPNGMVRDEWVNQKRCDHHYQRATYARWLVATLHGLPSAMGSKKIGICSAGIWRIPYLSAFLDRPLRWVPASAFSSMADLSAVAGWGQRKTSDEARSLAKRHHLPFIALEDGFLRSFGTGDNFPPLCMVVDDLGIYYDSTCSSTLEVLLASDVDVLQGIAADVASAKALVLAHRLSKYNHAPDWEWEASDPCLLPRGEGVIYRVLVIDQTAGDMSVALGGANADTFAAMLAAARSENPQATIYVKTHPEVTSGRKGGYLTQVQDGLSLVGDVQQRTVVLRQAINPLSLIEQMDKVYVVTSTMGFEALLAGKPVSVFGMPWYAGWGATDDRLTDSPALARRTRTRSVDELFAAAYFHYTRYLNPVTRERGTIFDVMDWLVRQREMAGRYPGRMVAVGFRRWKAANVKPLLSLDPQKVAFVPDAFAADALRLGQGDCLVFWGREAPAGLALLAQRVGARLLRMEDGFVRSVGLGSDLIAPLSLVLDDCGIYFDPTQPSGLERILATAEFSADELARAAKVRAFMVAHGITKYNLEPRKQAAWASAGKPVVLVPGQVEDDASIRFGCNGVKTNLGLLQAARRAHPDAFIVYKPHPDVMSGNRAGKLALAQAQGLADHVEAQLSVVSCIEACDVVHTMTSLTGLDALLRGKRVVVYGQPFYAGWGLTDDVLPDGAAFARRRHRPHALTLDELVAGTLLRYPIYWDWQLKGYTTCEAVLHRLLETRTALEANGGLEKLRLGFVRRQCRKLGILVRAWWVR